MTEVDDMLAKAAAASRLSDLRLQDYNTKEETR